MIDPASMMKRPERFWIGSGGGAALEASLVAAKVGQIDVLDGAQARDKASFMTAIARTLKFPDYFGANWDALVDCIDEIHWRDEPVILLIDHGDDLLADEPGQLDTLLGVLEEAFAVNPELPNSVLKVVIVATSSAPVIAHARTLGYAVGQL